MPQVWSDFGLANGLMAKLDPSGAWSVSNWQIALFVNDFDPVRDMVPGDFVQASFTGYAPIDVDPAFWESPVLVDDRWETQYSASPIVWENTGSGTQTVYGYVVWDLVAGEVIWAEQFDVPLTMAPTAVLSLTLKTYERNDPSPP